MDQQGRKLPSLPLRGGAFDQIPSQVAHHKATHGQPIGQKAIQQTGDGTGGNGLHAALHKEDAAAIGAHPIGLFKHLHPVALPVQQGRQQQARTSGPDDGNREVAQRITSTTVLSPRGGVRLRLGPTWRTVELPRASRKGWRRP